MNTNTASSPVSQLKPIQGFEKHLSLRSGFTPVFGHCKALVTSIRSRPTESEPEYLRRELEKRTDLLQRVEEFRATPYYSCGNYDREVLSDLSSDEFVEEKRIAYLSLQRYRDHHAFGLTIDTFYRVYLQDGRRKLRFLDGSRDLCMTLERQLTFNWFLADAFEWSGEVNCRTWFQEQVTHDHIDHIMGGVSVGRQTFSWSSDLVQCSYQRVNQFVEMRLESKDTTAYVTFGC